MKLALVVLLETKVKQSCYHYIANSIMPNGWRETSNIEDDSSTRTWTLWDPRMVHVMLSIRTIQNMICMLKSGNVEFFFSACYRFNSYMQRRVLWKSIIEQSKYSGLPWIAVGDFNTIRWHYENNGGATPRAVGLIEFNDFIQKAGLIDLKLNGPLFT